MSDHTRAIEAAMKAGGFDPHNHVARKAVEDAVTAYISERDEIGSARDLMSDWLGEGTEDLSDDTLVRVEIGKRCIVLDTLGNLRSAIAAPPAEGNAMATRKFGLRDRVRKTKGSSWQGHVVGFYSTSLTPIGYCVESERESGSVQLYPEAALEFAPDDGGGNG